VIEITNVGGDLRITGWEQNQLVAESDEPDGVHFDQDGDRLRLQASDDVTIRLPQGAQVSVRTVGGDARITRLTGQPLAIGNIGGDLQLRQIASANIGVVGGDVKAKHLTGDLQVGHVGGDLEAREVQGAFKSGNVGGDLFLGEVGGAIQAITGGDVTLSVNFQPELEYSIQTGSDLTCQVAPDASARLSLIAGGDISLHVPGAQVTGNGSRKTVTLGAGAAVVNMRAGGDISLTGLAFDTDAMGDFSENFGADIAAMAQEFGARIGATIEAQMADFDKQMAEGLSGLENLGTSRVDADKIAATARRAAERVQRVSQQQADAARRRAEKEAERAQRIAEAAQRRAEAINRKVRDESGRRGWPFRGDPRQPPQPPQPPRPPVPPRPFTPPPPPADPVSDEERMMILRMVEQGKISVADAEKLLAALENK